MDGLFDVFDEKPGDAPADQTSKQTKKRKANQEAEEYGETTQAPQSHSHDNTELQANGDGNLVNGADAPSPPSPAIKRQKRADSQEPVVTDAFETEQSREVEASAGLQAQKEGSAVILSHQVRHQVALPPDYDYSPISEHKSPPDPAKSFPFPLDPFQEVSIACIERNESVLVSAHTSAGKTVCAEYAIAQCLKNGQRVIYTSPIKALSNQKYREFMADFGDVGLMTGDVTINPTATCLVMTTEILRSMLYRGSEIMREVAWVIFDEVHYLRDKVRGVVWEETIILLPDKVHYVFLSATIPNAMQFAEWITKTHNQPCHVVYTDFRPTPLQHYLFPTGADGIHLVVDEKGTFREENFNKAMDSITEKRGDDPSDPHPSRHGKGKDKKFNKGGPKGQSDLWKAVRMIMTKAYNPVIVFSFSKKECESNAIQMSQMAFNDDSEKEMVTKVFDSAIETLSAEDKELPQIQHILPLLRRGIGVHHSGLLPILKETIEILFQEGLIKVLFATETFSIGLNMPAKTVVFTSVRKFDGTSARWVTASEFIQMSGRAGRRGIDARGIVIMMIDEKMDPATAKEIVRGEQDKLNSAFHLGYNMILNLMRVEGISPEFMLERCFSQFQNTASVSGLEKELANVEVETDNMTIEDEPTIKDYYDLRKQLDSYAQDVRSVITHPNHCLPFMQPGRLVQVRHRDLDFGYGIVVNFFERRLDAEDGDTALSDLKPQERWTVEVLVNVASDCPTPAARGKGKISPDKVRPPSAGDEGKMEIIAVLLSCVEAITHVRIFLSKDLRSFAERQKNQKSVYQVQKRFPEGIPVLDPIENMGITDDSFKKLVHKIEILESRLLANRLHNSSRLPELYNDYSKKQSLVQKQREIKKKINAALSVTQLDELRCRKRVLRRLNFINDADVVQMKARVACEISTGDELVLSELLFGKFFNDLSPEQCAAILSCFIFEEKSTEKKQMKEELAQPFKEVQKCATNIARISQESKLAVNEEEYVQAFKPQLMEVVYAWCKGMAFAAICKMTDVYEGNLIRLFRRLEELLRQMAQASKVMGSEDLEKKFEEALNKVRRDIVAAQSLYL